MEAKVKGSDRESVLHTAQAQLPFFNVLKIDKMKRKVLAASFNKVFGRW